MQLLKGLVCTAATLGVLCAQSVNAATEGQSIPPGDEIISTVLQMGFPEAAIAPPSGDEKIGRFEHLVIKNAMVIDGTGAPPQGPLTIHVKNDRIDRIEGIGVSSMHLDGSEYGDDVKVIDVKGGYVLPGFVDSHVHYGTPIHAFGGQLTDSDYVGKLLLAHGITSIRDAGSIMGLSWTLKHKELSEKGIISAPRINAYALFPETQGDPDAAREWVRAVKKRGADGMKLVGAPPLAARAAIQEATKLGMRTMYHHSQISVTRTTVFDSAEAGLTSMEHWYSLPEVMFEDRRIQHYPLDYNYNNESDRFSEAGKLWAQSAKPGSDTWKSTIDKLMSYDLTLVPTFNVYEVNRDFGRSRTLEWHDEYTMPYMLRAFTPNPKIHGSYHFDWTSQHEIDWKDNYRYWMQFVNDFKNAGGRVAVGGDSGFMFSIYGFGYVRELEMLQEAGFHPLEVIQAATMNGAQVLGLESEIGTIEPGKKADLVILSENPLPNFKVLYGNGHYRINETTGKMDRVQGIQYTVKDGIVYDAQRLLEEVRELVAEQKATEAAR